VAEAADREPDDDDRHQARATGGNADGHDDPEEALITIAGIAEAALKL